MKPKIDYYVNKLLSRKFQVFAVAVALFILTDKFDATSLVVEMCAYMGFSVAQKFAPPYQE